MRPTADKVHIPISPLHTTTTSEPTISTEKRQSMMKSPVSFVPCSDESESAHNLFRTHIRDEKKREMLHNQIKLSINLRTTRVHFYFQ